MPPSNETVDLQSLLASPELTLAEKLSLIPIDHTAMPGIGPTFVKRLNAYGICTAADLIESRIFDVPGINYIKTRTLLDWRWSLESRIRQLNVPK